ncbi:hypothetical protein ACER0A_014455 (plasmid) [Haloimpatiens sp. FM7315]|uniref:hypothetical protein n=1 Tax=Haloimpatiens sp. FM7315 TaxID=3298609 RepID=UPI0035A33C06
MSRGRKKINNAKKEVISVRITSEQKEVLDKNPWLRLELNKYVRDYLQAFVFKN